MSAIPSLNQNLWKLLG